MGKTTKSFVVLVEMLSLILLVGTGCKDDPFDPKKKADISSLVYGETSAYLTLNGGIELRVIHASPGAPGVDIYVESKGVAGSSDDNNRTHIKTDGDRKYTYNIEIRAAGDPSSSDPVFETGNISIAKNSVITAIASGMLGSGNPDDQFRVLLLNEDFGNPGPGNTAVRIVHAGYDATTVALDVGNDGNPEITGFERFADTGEAGVPLSSDTELQIAVWAGSPLQRVTVFTTPQLPEGANLFVIATGLLGKLPREFDGFNLLAVGPSGTIGFIRQNPVVFALHGSPDAPAVDIYAGAAELVDNLSFGELSGSIQVPPGSYTLDFKVHDDGATAASISTPALAVGERYLAIASGFVGGSPAFTLLPFADAFGLGGFDPLAVVIHASPDAPPVDVGTVSSGVFTPVDDIKNLSFTDSSPGSGTVLPIASFQVGVATVGSTSPVATFNLTTVLGLRAYAVALGSLDSNGESFRLVLVNTSVFPWAAAEVMPN